MYDSWTCVAVEKGPGVLPDPVRTALRNAACDLYLKKWDRMHLRGDLLEGIIQTAWTTHLIGTRSGVLFRAHVDCEDGTDYMVNFLLHERDLERGADIIRQHEEGAAEEWHNAPGGFPVPELYEFHNLREPMRSKQ